MRCYWRIVLTLLALPSGLVGQQTWKVDCWGGAGSHFTDIPPAVAAAAPGDTILVYYTVGGGSCGYYTAPIITKPLQIIGFKVGEPPGNNTPTVIAISGALSISNIPAGQHVCLSNVYISHWVTSPGQAGSPIQIADCAGIVVLENIIFANIGTPAQHLEITRCDHVVLRGCNFAIGGDPIQITDSNVLLSTTLVYDQPPFPLGGVGYTATTESLRLLRSTVTLSGSNVFGATAWGFGLPQRSAATLEDSTLRIGASCTLRGGRIPGTTGTSPQHFTAAYQFVGTGPSLVEKDARAPAFSYVPGQDPVITPIHETFHDWVVADEWYTVRVLGPQNGFVLLTIGSMSFPTPSPLGELGIDLATLVPVELVALTHPDGVYTWQFHCPSWVAVDAASAFQSATLAPTGEFGVTTPSPLIPAWDKTAIP